MSGVIVSEFAVVFVALVLAMWAFLIWAIGDVASRSRSTFDVTGMSKTTWLALFIMFTFVTGFVGVGIALNYVFVARPKITSISSASDTRQRGFAFGVVVPLVLAGLILVAGHGLLRSPSTTTRPIAAVKGHLAGACTAAGVPGAGEPYTVKLTSKGAMTAHTEVVGGDSGTRLVSFTVTPGTWTLTARSGTITHRWGLSYVDNHAVTQPHPYFTIMNVAIPVACARPVSG